MVAYEIFELKQRWHTGPNQTKAGLLARLVYSKDTLDEGISIPIEADLLDFVPELLDPYLGNGTPEADAECARLQDEIVRSIKEHGVWISKTGRRAVIPSGVVLEDG